MVKCRLQIEPTQSVHDLLNKRLEPNDSTSWAQTNSIENDKHRRTQVKNHQDHQLSSQLYGNASYRGRNYQESVTQTDEWNKSNMTPTDKRVVRTPVGAATSRPQSPYGYGARASQDLPARQKTETSEYYVHSATVRESDNSHVKDYDYINSQLNTQRSVLESQRQAPETHRFSAKGRSKALMAAAYPPAYHYLQDHIARSPASSNIEARKMQANSNDNRLIQHSENTGQTEESGWKTGRNTFMQEVLSVPPKELQCQQEPLGNTGAHGSTLKATAGAQQLHGIRRENTLTPEEFEQYVQAKVNLQSDESVGYTDIQNFEQMLDKENIQMNSNQKIIVDGTRHVNTERDFLNLANVSAKRSHKADDEIMKMPIRSNKRTLEYDSSAAIQTPQDISGTSPYDLTLFQPNLTTTKDMVTLSLERSKIEQLQAPYDNIKPSNNHGDLHVSSEFLKNHLLSTIKTDEYSAGGGHLNVQLQGGAPIGHNAEVNQQLKSNQSTAQLLDAFSFRK